MTVERLTFKEVTTLIPKYPKKDCLIIISIRTFLILLLFLHATTASESREYRSVREHEKIFLSTGDPKASK